MFALVIILCAGTVGSPAESCDSQVVDSGLTLAECGRAIAVHANRQNMAEFQCLRMVRDGDKWESR